MKIFEPLNVNGMVLPNRVMVPAMVTRLSGEDGQVNQPIIDRYVRYAQGGAGLIVVEAMAVHKGKAGPLLRISDDEFIPGLRRLTDAIHASGPSKVVPQIIHFLKAARSGWRQTLDMLSNAEIDSIIEDFGDAAVRAREAGFDGVELHAAHGYTLSSFLSRRNPRRDAHSGRTMEGRLHMLGRVVENVRKKVGKDWPVCARFVAEECIKDGYTVEEGKLIALRMAQLGIDLISISMGGKHEDAEHKPGEVPHGYSGYSGDRCMPGDWYPKLLNAHIAETVRRFLDERGFAKTPIAIAGKISEPEDAERLLAERKTDVLAIARQLLADPDWVVKLQRGEADRIIRCTYCNVCKKLDGEHKDVICFLWPKGSKQAPPDRPDLPAPAWGADKGNLTGEVVDGTAKLKWSAAQGPIAGYEVMRADDEGTVHIMDTVKGTQAADRLLMAGRRYRYYVRARDEVGHVSPPSNTVLLEPELVAAE
ncbi:MAG: NADH:flavin oxidoreductase [Rhodospirillales bacterium]|nr:NADH:flavin oxidoreductase [Rhodospirillales bacterium]